MHTVSPIIDNVCRLFFISFAGQNFKAHIYRICKRTANRLFQSVKQKCENSIGCTTKCKNVAWQFTVFKIMCIDFKCAKYRITDTQLQGASNNSQINAKNRPQHTEPSEKTKKNKKKKRSEKRFAASH